MSQIVMNVSQPSASPATPPLASSGHGQQAQIATLNEDARQLLWSEPRQSLALSEEALQLWQSDIDAKNAPALHAEILNNLAESHYQLAQYDNALLYIPEALDLFKATEDAAGEVRAMSLIGATLAALGTYSDALDWLFRAAQLAQDIQNPRAEALALNRMAMVYVRLEDLETAIHYLQDAFQLLEQAGEPDKSLRGALLDSMAVVMLEAADYENAMTSAEDALALHRDSGYMPGQCRAYLVAGRIYTARKDFANALAMFQHSMEIADASETYPQQIESRLYVADVYSELDRMVGLLAHLQEALALAEKIQSRDLMMRSHGMLAKVYKKSHNYEAALKHQEIYQRLYQAIYNDEADKRRKNLQIAYQVEAARKETEVYQLRNEQLQREVGRRKRAESQVNNRLQQSTIVLQVFDEMNSSLEFEQAALLALDAAQRLSGARGAFLALVEDGAKSETAHTPDRDTAPTMRIQTTIGQYTSNDLNRTFVLDAELFQRLFDERQPIRMHNPRALSNFPVLKNMLTRVLIPLIARERLIGLVNLETDKPERFHDDALHLLQLMQHYIAQALDNARLHDEVGRHLDAVSRLEQLKTDMIRIAAHDLKNPVAIIKGYAHLIRMHGEAGDKERQDHALDMVDKGVERMTNMIDNILSLERIEQMASTGMKDTIRLSGLVKHVFANYRALAEKTHEYRLDLVEEVPNIIGDRAQLEEAMSNLISNAIKYTPEDGLISVSLEQEAETIRFKVRDTGFGIPEEDQAKLFQPFYRVKTDETTDIEGTGLGLHLVKNIIERHGGKMIFESVYGEGSMFGFEIKLAS